jgi:hypothetical protein
MDSLAGYAHQLQSESDGPGKWGERETGEVPGSPKHPKIKPLESSAKSDCVEKHSGLKIASSLRIWANLSSVLLVLIFSHSLPPKKQKATLP